jgi:glycosyltransferase involved in cell wall biosynthesis
MGPFEFPPLKSPRIVAIPIAFNEELKIGSVLDRFAEVKGVDIAVLDDGSTDRTPQVIVEKGAMLIQHAKRSGAGAAIRTAYRWAGEHGYDICVIMAGNDKDRAAEIFRLIQPIAEGKAVLVQGSRYLPGGNYGNMPFYRRVSTQFVHPLLFSAFARQRMTDTTNGYRALRLEVLKDERLNLNQDWLDKYELEPYLLYKLIRLGYPVMEAPVTKIYPLKQLGQTKMKPITGWWSILRPILLLGFGFKK